MQTILFMYNILKSYKNKLIYIYVNLFLVFIFSLIYWYFGTSENLKFDEYCADKNNKNNISYLSALYFACSTHSTVGYGDITPKSKFMQTIIIIQFIILILNLSLLIL
jgi:hypothetical protein